MPLGHLSSTKLGLGLIGTILLVVAVTIVMITSKPEEQESFDPRHHLGEDSTIGQMGGPIPSGNELTQGKDRRVPLLPGNGKAEVQPSLEFLVINWLGRPIQGAEIFSKTATLVTSLGRSDSQGRLPCETPLHCDSVVAVQDGFSDGAVAVSAVVQSGTVEIVLREEGRIDGVVVDDSTGLPLSGVLVYGRPSSQSRIPNPYDMLLAGEHSPVVATSVTGENGQFTLSGLDAADSYALVAAKEGMYSTNSILDARAGTSGHVLEVGPIYGLRFRFVAPGGAASEANDWIGVLNSTRVMSLLGMRDLDCTRIDDSVANLTGVNFVDKPEDTFFVALRPAEYSERVGPFTLEVRLPGFEHMDVPLYATRLDGTFKTTEIPLRPNSSGVGSVAIELSGFPGDLNRGAADLPAGALHFHSSDGQEFMIGMTYGMLQSGTPLNGIPFGEYKVHFQGYLNHSIIENVGASDGSGGFFRVESAETTLSLDFSSIASIELEMLDRNGNNRPDKAGFHPQRVVQEKDGGTGFRSYGTIGIRWPMDGQRAMVLVDPGKYVVESTEKLVSLDPAIGVGPNGRLEHPVNLDISAGDRVVLIWQKY